METHHRRDAGADAIAAALGAGWQGARVAVVLGSGLGGAAKCLQIREEVPFEDVRELGACGVPGHDGRLLRGRAAGVEVVLFQGRRHLYEGVAMGVAALPARVGAALGARLLVSLSAVGAVDRSLGVGAWVLVEDHLNLMGRNPLEGVRDEEGPAFVDLSQTYRADLFDDLRRRLSVRGMRVARGVLAAFPGPTYETPAEVRMAGTLGASLVGMSTVPEAVWARYLGMDVVAWGRVSNPAAGVAAGPIDHLDVLRQSEFGGDEGARVIEESITAWQGVDTGG